MSCISKYRRRIFQGAFLGLLLLIFNLLQAADNNPVAAGDSSEAPSVQYILPLPDSLPFDQEKAALGHLLFEDPGLSGGAASCATCHALDKAGVDQKPKSIDIRGGFDQMNTLTVFNAVFNFRMLWRGDARDAKEQVDMVVRNERHIGAGWDTLLDYVRSQSQYRQKFADLYDGVISPASVADALVEFERTLITPNAPFDRYLKGEQDAISKQQKRGYELFVDYGCVACHQGVNVGGNMFARFGVFSDPYAEKGEANDFDLGRFSITGKETDKYVLRVPSLRNVARTAPYFHDGSVATLEGAVKRMGYYQLGRSIPEDDVEKIVLFLQSLTGEYQGKPL